MSAHLCRTIALALTISALLTACQTLLSGRDGSAYTEIITVPDAASVTIEGFGTCQSPCRMTHDVPRTVTIAKAGFIKQSFVVKPGAGKVRVQLELAAPSEDVEATALPEL